MQKYHFYDKLLNRNLNQREYSRKIKVGVKADPETEFNIWNQPIIPPLIFLLVKFLPMNTKMKLYLLIKMPLEVMPFATVILRQYKNVLCSILRFYISIDNYNTKFLT